MGEKKLFRKLIGFLVFSTTIMASYIYLNRFRILKAILLLIGLSPPSLIFKRHITKFDNPPPPVEFIKTKHGLMLIPKCVLDNLQNNKKIGIVYHGNNANVVDTYTIFERILPDDFNFDNTGVNLAFIEHPGNMGLNVDFTEKYVNLGALECVDVLVKKGFDVVVSTGFSLGTALATNAAIACKLKKLVLNAPFSSFSEIAKQKNPFSFLQSMLMKTCKIYDFEFKTANKLKNSNINLKIFHGNRDSNINIENSLEIEKFYGKKGGCLKVMDGVRHAPIPKMYLDYLVKVLK